MGKGRLWNTGVQSPGWGSKEDVGNRGERMLATRESLLSPKGSHSSPCSASSSGPRSA